jgi:hypothetical protein
VATVQAAPYVHIFPACVMVISGHVLLHSLPSLHEAVRQSRDMLTIRAPTQRPADDVGSRSSLLALLVAGGRNRTVP